MTMRGARACEQPHGDFHVSIPLMAFAAITVPLLRATPAADDAVWGSMVTWWQFTLDRNNKSVRGNLLCQCHEAKSMDLVIVLTLL